MSTTEPAVAPERTTLVRRVFRYPLVQAIEGALMVMLAVVLVTLAVRATPLEGDAAALVQGVLSAVVIVLAWKAYKRWIEREPDREFARAGAPLELAAGLAVGAALFTTVTGVVWLLGGIRFTGMRPIGETELATWVAIALVSGLFEETLFRGLLFRAVEKVSGSWVALAVTSAFFGLAHIFNPDSSWFAALAIAVEAGILLGAAYMLTRRLWFAVGLHAAWNFTQGWVFSVPVSGGGAPIGLIATTRKGPEWLTGGAFGLEASMIAMLVATALGVVLLAVAARRGRVRGRG